MNMTSDMVEQAIKQMVAENLDARRWRWWQGAPISERAKLAEMTDTVAMNAYIDARLKGQP